ncbi:MAG: hypothetical protein AAGD96_31760 [Chloroflexota bacterium]
MFDRIKQFRNKSLQRREIEAEMKQQKRLPPGQRATLKFPILTIGKIPEFDPDTW